MPRSSLASSFGTLRSWDGSQAIRTGNPDGGVEWYATLSHGTEWGWQAKHVHGIDALLSAMTSPRLSPRSIVRAS